MPYSQIQAFLCMVVWDVHAHHASLSSRGHRSPSLHCTRTGVTCTHRCFSWHILTLKMAPRSSGYTCSPCARASLSSVLVESCFGHQMPAILDLSAGGAYFQRWTAGVGPELSQSQQRWGEHQEALSNWSQEGSIRERERIQILELQGQGCSC